MIRTRLQGDTPFFPNMLNNGNIEVCLKEDVDKVLSHNKYKRCLAMAMWCEMCHKELLTRACLPTKQNWNRHDEWRYFVDFWYRYEYRFRKLAEKFKEAK